MRDCVISQTASVPHPCCPVCFSRDSRSQSGVHLQKIPINSRENKLLQRKIHKQRWVDMSVVPTKTLLCSKKRKRQVQAWRCGGYPVILKLEVAPHIFAGPAGSFQEPTRIVCCSSSCAAVCDSQSTGNRLQIVYCSSLVTLVCLFCTRLVYTHTEFVPHCR